MDYYVILGIILYDNNGANSRRHPLRNHSGSVGMYLEYWHLKARLRSRGGNLNICGDRGGGSWPSSVNTDMAYTHVVWYRDAHLLACIQVHA